MTIRLVAMTAMRMTHSTEERADVRAARRSDVSRVVLGVIASAATLLALLAPLSFLVMQLDGDSMPLGSQLSLSVVAIVLFGIVLVPAALIICAILFGGAYLFLRTIGQLDRRAFPLIGPPHSWCCSPSILAHHSRGQTSCRARRCSLRDGSPGTCSRAWLYRSALARESIGAEAEAAL